MESRISAMTSLYAFIASPAHHSKSPLMHNCAFKELGVNSVYLAFDIESDKLKDTIKGFKAMGVKGANISMPHKQNIIPYLDQISTASRLCNAVNTIILKDNKYYGTITDGIGFIKSLEEKNWSINSNKITMVGAGGASTAIMVQMALDGAKEIVVYNRTIREEFIEIINNTSKETGCLITLKPLSDTSSLRQDMQDSYLFINTTGVGMEPMLNQSVVPDSSYFHPDLKVADIIYQPAVTKMLQMALDAGCEIMNGELMLLYQGAESFKIWTDLEMPINKVKKVLGIEVK
ncbi:shikimate dehydrogenase [Thomasclavelia cocleata]|uniref:Shikimate dehydrogenase (NADP(+)) n=1 Tax=Thomasclavelia cocleata TaxID=69824 RepID=A0A1I0G019_9FIRM|nr:shikimate dehydrogenase [Thomasclavelia cocleata]MCR1961010.1 shikimate dehydrogenase [Thomasclavelia cocleata]NDO43060.1 shikimate dehydrogenase [Thomasclavelia cocleata]PJN79474.1 shikimate dehydrogenase [Thomasclavelia cocleata]SET64046.1 shikimate dehydrogenase [Thomasclavelia cocleata]